MTTQTIQIGGRKCMAYMADQPELLLVQPVDYNDMEVLDNEVAIIESQTMKPFSLVTFEVKDWFGELTPWPAPAVFGNIPFGDGAENTLSFITDVLLPELRKRQIYDEETMKSLIGGYSLAGFFALWACYQSQMFHSVAAVSPSVWYPDWIRYAENHKPMSSSVYLSLGDKEEKARNPVMAQVGDCIRRQHEMLVDQGVNTILEWNKGNHFQHTGERTAKGFAWLLNQM
ncbi:MAG: esterase [Prevotella sp.]|nr:esterase [Prevotella sp.]